MDQGGVVIAISIGVLLVVLTLAGKANSAKEIQLAEVSKLPEYKIFTLGTSGAGKTCFLASMFHKLSVYSPDIGFYIRASNQQNAKLIKVHNAIVDPYGHWPAGTVAEHEWRFTTYVPSSDGLTHHPVLEFSYLDYAGGHLKDPDQSEMLAAQAHIDAADGVLVLLDGSKVMHRLRGTEDAIPNPDERLGSDLNFMMPYLNRCGRKPVHIVISKSDLLEREFSLRQVRDCLLQYPMIRSFVAQRQAHGARTRLIPVSAVGTGFASLGSDGAMRKNPKVIPVPNCVEVSMAATMIDVFESLRARLSSEQTRLINSALANPEPARLQQVFAILETIKGLPFPYSTPALVGDVLRLLWWPRASHVVDPAEHPAMQVVRDRGSAIRGAIGSHHLLMRKFEAQFPDSFFESQHAARGTASRAEWS